MPTPAENGQAFRQLLENRAGAKMPPPMQLTVTNGSQQFVDGVVWGNLEGIVARVVIGGNYDYRDGEHVIYALPMGVGGTQEFIFIAPTWNGPDASRVPRQRLKVKVYTNNVTTPTDAELDSIFGTPAANKGEIMLIDDNGAGTNMYLVASDGTNWWYTSMTKAT